MESQSWFAQYYVGCVEPPADPPAVKSLSSPQRFHRAGGAKQGMTTTTVKAPAPVTAAISYFYGPSSSMPSFEMIQTLIQTLRVADTPRLGSKDSATSASWSDSLQQLSSSKRSRPSTARRAGPLFPDGATGAKYMYHSRVIPEAGLASDSPRMKTRPQEQGKGHLARLAFSFIKPTLLLTPPRVSFVRRHRSLFSS